MEHLVTLLGSGQRPPMWRRQQARSAAPHAHGGCTRGPPAERRCLGGDGPAPPLSRGPKGAVWEPTSAGMTRGWRRHHVSEVSVTHTRDCSVLGREMLLLGLESF